MISTLLLESGEKTEVVNKNNIKKPERDLYTSLVTEAPYIEGDATKMVPIDDIPWVDKSLMEHSITFHRKYFTFVLFSNTLALMFGLAVKPNSAVLLRTGKLQDPESSFRRYLSTIQRIGKFFMLPFNPAKAYKSFDTVRKMHVLASKRHTEDDKEYSERVNFSEKWKADLAKAMERDLDYIDTSSAPKHLLTWDPVVPVSQFDMAITQFGFIGTMWLFPKTYGIHDRQEEMKGVLHTWAIFGRLLGIKDEFNICINPDPVLFDRLFVNIVVESLKTMDETVITIQKAFVDSFSKRVPFVTYKAMLLVGLQNLEGYKGAHLWELMNWLDKLSYYAVNLWMWAMRTSTMYKSCVHILTGLYLQFQFWLHLPTSLWD